MSQVKYLAGIIYYRVCSSPIKPLVAAAAAAELCERAWVEMERTAV